jgi:hypothetical protein
MEFAMATLQQPVVGFTWDIAVDLSSRENQARLSPAAIKGLRRIASHWDLSEENTRDLLGGPTYAGFSFNWDIQGAEHTLQPEARGCLDDFAKYESNFWRRHAIKLCEKRWHTGSYESSSIVGRSSRR